MIIWAISDLHLPAKKKPMDIFGPHWSHHFERISDDWKSRVSESDVVLLPGDLSWAMQLEEAQEDLEKIGALPGTKLLLRGNHDYWWNSIGKVRRTLPENCYALQNDAMLINGYLFAGSRGWTIPAEQDEESDDAKIYRRERQRLEMSLKCARAKSEDAPLIVMMHYPPRSDTQTGFSDLLLQYRADEVVYGHLHGAGLAGAINGRIDGLNYHQVSCDGLDFRLAHIISEETAVE